MQLFLHNTLFYTFLIFLFLHIINKPLKLFAFNPVVAKSSLTKACIIFNKQTTVLHKIFNNLINTRNFLTKKQQPFKKEAVVFYFKSKNCSFNFRLLFVLFHPSFYKVYPNQKIDIPLPKTPLKECRPT